MVIALLILERLCHKARGLLGDFVFQQREVVKGEKANRQHNISGHICHPYFNLFLKHCS